MTDPKMGRFHYEGLTNMTHNKSVTPDFRDTYLPVSNTSCCVLSISGAFTANFSKIQLIKINLMKR